MKNATRHKARLRLDQRLQPLNPVDRFAPPPKGWLRAIREALGMSGAQLGLRLGISPQSVDAMERSEATGTVKLETLRRAAEALDCTLVYAFVPNKPLETKVQERARALALREFDRIAHSMKLEDQESGGEDREARVADYVRDHLRLRDLWNGE
ncbi:MAG: mobile mystery protein A [Phyllobacteriaceae bacterium]|nr:mobile mystery protein A [Phyllobacteriaceae bacterium]